MSDITVLDVLFNPEDSIAEIKAQIEGHPSRDDCDEDCGEYVICGVRDCPLHDPLHYHHDGCPSEYIAAKAEGGAE